MFLTKTWTKSVLQAAVLISRVFKKSTRDRWPDILKIEYKILKIKSFLTFKESARFVNVKISERDRTNNKWVVMLTLIHQTARMLSAEELTNFHETSVYSRGWEWWWSCWPRASPPSYSRRCLERRCRTNGESWAICASTKNSQS